MYNYRCKIENLCTGCVCTMDMFASLNFHTFIFYFPMVPNTCIFTCLMSNSNLVLLHVSSTPTLEQKYINYFIFPPPLVKGLGII